MNTERIGVDYPGITTVFYCHDGQGNVFLSKRGENVRDEKGTWEPGAGGLDFGLTVEENVRKELSEEYGAIPKQVDFLGYFDSFRQNAQGQKTHWLALIFAVLVDRDALKNNEPDFIADVGWFTLDALPEPLHSNMHPILEKVGEKLKELMEA